VVVDENQTRLPKNQAGENCRVMAYCDAVLNGTRAAGKWIRLACSRHVRDMESAHERGLWWDGEAASHAIEFFTFLRHSKGRWNDEPFVLSDWQAFIVGSIFGWKREDSEKPGNWLRRFRIAFVEVPRKNGKTTLAAGIGLYLLVCDGEAGAEIYSAATKRDQAKLVFEDAKAIVGRCPSLARVIERYRYSLQIPAIRSKFEPLGADGDTLDGLNPFVAICDEIHAWKSRDLWDVLLTGMGAREQPLSLAITTAGDFSDSIYNELHNDAEQVLDGVVNDDAIFGFIACLDADDDWKDERVWAKANPNLGVSLKLDELTDAIRRAERQPSAQNKTKRNRLGIRTAALNAWLRLDQWDASGKPFDPAELEGRPCYGGLDLASSCDLAAFVLAFPWDQVKGQPYYRLLAWLFCPADADDQQSEKLRRRLQPWADSKFVEFTPGNVIDISRIESVIVDASKMYEIKSVAYDPFNCESTSQRLTAEGIEALKFPQNSGHYNEPMKAFERAILDKRLAHNGNPVLRWMASNCVLISNGAGLVMPSRKNSREKIDGIVASVMAVGCHLRSEKPDSKSVYEERGFDQ
jgi:phage terminase large subunit-like protein